ncbi:MAG: hypothetical protein IKU90_05785, partial [Clostridia bacterium]|nr:hypothetical protein [Clostridia bacterium]
MSHRIALSAQILNHTLLRLNVTLGEGTRLNRILRVHKLQIPLSALQICGVLGKQIPVHIGTSALTDLIQRTCGVGVPSQSILQTAGDRASNALSDGRHGTGVLRTPVPHGVNCGYFAPGDGRRGGLCH